MSRLIGVIYQYQGKTVNYEGKTHTLTGYYQIEKGVQYWQASEGAWLKMYLNHPNPNKAKIIEL